MIQDAFESHTGERPPLHAPDPEQSQPDPYLVSVERAERHAMRASTALTEAIDETVRFCLDHKQELR
jgi:hypothetical protein